MCINTLTNDIKNETNCRIVIEDSSAYTVID